MIQRITICFISILLCASTSLVAQDGGSEVVLSTGEEGPAVLYDGKEISQKELSNLDPAAIGDISILSGEEAKAKFGKYGELGAIIVSSPAKAKAMNETITTTTSVDGVPSEREAEEIKMSFDPSINYHIIIDGKPANMEALRAIPTANIDQMQIHEPLYAQDLFGDVAKEGAIVVTTK